VWIALVVLIAAAGAVLALGDDNPKTATDEELKTTSGLLRLIESQSEEYLLVDVRTDEEYQSGHIPTAINIPYNAIVNDLPEGPKDRLIIVYCRSGARSGRAERWLRADGYTNVVDFGGILSWRGPVVVPESHG
jgi:phage shock protein E